MATETVERTRCDVCNKVKSVTHVNATLTAAGAEPITWGGDMCAPCWKRAQGFFSRGTTPPKKRATSE